MSKTKVLTLASPIGAIRIVANEKGVERIKAADATQHSDSVVGQEIEDDVALQHAATCKHWLEQYFNNPAGLSKAEEPQLDFRGRDGFQETVWDVLREQTKIGQSISYGELAALAGSPRACQAVGNAMKKNPFPFVVPCHRVLPASGSIGSYSFSGGSKTKQWLLEHERKSLETH